MLYNLYSNTCKVLIVDSLPTETLGLRFQVLKIEFTIFFSFYFVQPLPHWGTCAKHEWTFFLDDKYG